MLVLCVPDGSTVAGSDTGAVEKSRTRVVLPLAGVADDSGCVDDIPEGVLVVLSIVDSEGGIVSVGVTAMSETLRVVEGEIKLLVAEGELKLLVAEGGLKLLVAEGELKLLVAEGGLKLLVDSGMAGGIAVDSGIAGSIAVDSGMDEEDGIAVVMEYESQRAIQAVCTCITHISPQQQEEAHSLCLLH